MCDLTVNRLQQLEELRKRRDELDALWRDPPDPGQIGKIEQLMNDITSRIDALQTIIDNNEPASVVISYPTAEEKEKALKAMDKLSKVIQRSQTINEIILTVTAILQFTDTVINA